MGVLQEVELLTGEEESLESEEGRAGRKQAGV